jgi:hypothetical protein
MTTLHQDPEIALASAVGFVAVGKLVEWIAGHAEFFAGISYILASAAALITIYYKIREHHKRDKKK